MERLHYIFTPNLNITINYWKWSVVKSTVFIVTICRKFLIKRFGNFTSPWLDWQQVCLLVHCPVTLCETSSMQIGRLQISLSVNHPFTMDNLLTNQLTVSQVADWSTRGLVNSPTAISFRPRKEYIIFLQFTQTVCNTIDYWKCSVV